MATSGGATAPARAATRSVTAAVVFGLMSKIRIVGSPSAIACSFAGLLPVSCAHMPLRQVAKT
jgi:hypothetical protein